MEFYGSNSCWVVSPFFELGMTSRLSTLGFWTLGFRVNHYGYRSTYKTSLFPLYDSNCTKQSN